MYLNPICDELLLDAGFLRLHRSTSSLAPGVGLSVFQVLSSRSLLDEEPLHSAQLPS